MGREVALEQNAGSEAAVYVSVRLQDEDSAQGSKERPVPEAEAVEEAGHEPLYVFADPQSRCAEGTERVGEVAGSMCCCSLRSASRSTPVLRTLDYAGFLVGREQARSASEEVHGSSGRAAEAHIAH